MLSFKKGQDIANIYEKPKGKSKKKLKNVLTNINAE